MMGKFKVVFLYFLFFLWATSIVYNASREAGEIPRFVSHVDKLAHFLYYIPGGYVSAYLFYMYGTTPLFGVIPPVIMGFVDEFIQSFTPGRYPDFFDFVADLLGISAGIFLFRLRNKKS